MSDGKPTVEETKQILLRFLMPELDAIIAAARAEGEHKGQDEGFAAAREMLTGEDRCDGCCPDHRWADADEWREGRGE